MKFKRFIAACGVAIVLSVSLSPSILGAEEPARTDPAKYQKRDPDLKLKDNTEEETKDTAPVAEEVRQLQFDQPLKQEYKEAVSAISFTGDDQSTTGLLASKIGLFDATEPLPQQAPDEGTTTAWLPWAIGSVATILVAGLLVYLIPALSNVAEE